MTDSQRSDELSEALERVRHAESQPSDEELLAALAHLAAVEADEYDQDEPWTQERNQRARAQSARLLELREAESPDLAPTAIAVLAGLVVDLAETVGRIAGDNPELEGHRQQAWMVQRHAGQIVEIFDGREHHTIDAAASDRFKAPTREPRDSTAAGLDDLRGDQ